MKVLVVEPNESRRADLVDAISALRGIEVRAVVSTTVDCVRLLMLQVIDVVVAGDLDARDLSVLRGMLRVAKCELIAGRSPREVAESLESLREVVERRIEGDIIDLREWLPRTVADKRGALPDSLLVVSLIADGTPRVICDAHRLEQAVLSMVYEASSDLVLGGTVWLTAEPTDDGMVCISALESGGGAVTARSLLPAATS